MKSECLALARVMYLIACIYESVLLVRETWIALSIMWLFLYLTYYT